ncbi:non-specific serine/threonine protein kinase [Trifolium repens]|nr:non-specific serine/threonine protein kinase [Trifolium repens]
MSSLNIIAAVDNNFSGSLPPNMFHTLPNLQFFSVAINHFHGHIPTSIANASTLTSFEIGANHFVGQVPNLGSVGYAPPEYGMGSEVSTCGDMIGLICSMESPKERMNIVDVSRELNIIGKTFLAGFRTHN